jgi:hypothetical protein
MGGLILRTGHSDAAEGIADRGRKETLMPVDSLQKQEGQLRQGRGRLVRKMPAILGMT